MSPAYSCSLFTKSLKFTAFLISEFDILNSHKDFKSVIVQLNIIKIDSLSSLKVVGLSGFSFLLLEFSEGPSFRNRHSTYMNRCLGRGKIRLIIFTWWKAKMFNQSFLPGVWHRNGSD